MSVLAAKRKESRDEAIAHSIELHEYEIRRDYQNAGIVNCNQLIGQLQHVVDVFNVDLNIYSKYIKAIDREIELIKKWRQRDNKIKSYLPG